VTTFKKNTEDVSIRNERNEDRTRMEEETKDKNDERKKGKKQRDKRGEKENRKQKTAGGWVDM